MVRAYRVSRAPPGRSGLPLTCTFLLALLRSPLFYPIIAIHMFSDNDFPSYPGTSVGLHRLTAREPAVAPALRPFLRPCRTSQRLPPV